MANYVNSALPLWKQLLYTLIEDEKQFADAVKQISQELNMTLKELAEKADIPSSTLYKLSSTDSDVRISTIRKLILFVREQELKDLHYNKTVGLITSRDVLDEFGNIIELDGESVRIREYLANTIEEEIILGVRAAQDGMGAIICGPVAANTLKKILEIPVIGITFSRNSLVDAIKKAYPKI